MKRSLIVVSGVVLLVLSVIGTTALASQAKEGKEYSLKLIYDDEYVLDERLNEESNVIIKYEDDILHDYNIFENEVITLDEIELPDNKVISYWDIKENENQYTITPVIVKKNEIDISFITTNGGQLNDKALLPSMTKSVEQKTKLSEILPEIQKEENYHFAGWFKLEDIENKVEIKEDDREDIKELESKLKKKEKEKKKGKGFKKEIKEIKKDIEDKKKEKKYDTEIINEYVKVEDIDNIVLDNDEEYIAVLYPDVNDNGKDDRKEKIDISIDFGLDNEVQDKKIHVGQPIKLSRPYHKDYIFIDWFLDKGFNEKLGEKKTFEKNTTIFAQWKTPKEIVSEGGDNLITNERISDRIEEYLSNRNENNYKEQKEKSKDKEKKLKEKYDDETVQHTENQYTLKNFNLDQTYLIKFYDEEEFLFSVALPYGRSLEILNGNEQKVKEYGIRQNNSIDLSKFTNNSKDIDFDIKTIKENNAVVTKIYPKNNKEMN